VVVTYHFASRWYAEDALVTSGPRGREFELRYETYTDRSVYEPSLLADAAADAGPGGSRTSPRWRGVVAGG
jgi:hypothetical protein